MHKSAVSDKE